MSNVSKIVGSIVMSSALVSSSTVGLATTLDGTKVDMQLGLSADISGKSVGISVRNISNSKAIKLSIKLDGDVRYKSLEFTDYLRSNGQVDVEYVSSTKVINISIVSDKNIVKDGVLEIGTLHVDGEGGIEYRIMDNVVEGKPSITVDTASGSKLYDDNLEEIGATVIKIPSNVTPPVEDDKEDDDTDDGNNGGNTDDGSDNEDSLPSNETVSLDGAIIATPKSKEELSSEVSAILSKDSNAVVVNKFNYDDFMLYRVRYKDRIDGILVNVYREIKVLKSVSSDTSLNGIKESITGALEEGKKNVRLYIPNNKEQLDSFISTILAKDSEAKIVDIKEDSLAFMYRVKFEDKVGSTVAVAYIDIKVSKTISKDKGLPGVKIDENIDMDTGNGSDDKEDTENNGSGSEGGNGNIGDGSTEDSEDGENSEERKETEIISLIGDDRFDTAIEVSKNGWPNGAKTVVIVNGSDKHIVDGLSASPLASIKDAPLLLSNNGVLTENTIKELKRLNPSQVYIIGGQVAMPSSVEAIIRGALTDVSVTRLGGNSRYETSLMIAKEIDRDTDISKIYVSGGYGEVDALSIAPIAGREKCPIILSEIDGLDEATFNYIKSEDVKDAYFIGGKVRVSDNAINQINSIVEKNVAKNRVAGENRKGTNAKVIEKFYTDTDLSGVVVTKDDILVDALTVGSLASKYNMPIVIASDSLNTEQEVVLSKKRAEKLYQVGGGINPTVIGKVKELVDNLKK